MLISRGCNINANNKYGRNTLHIVVWNGNILCVNLLLNRGINVNENNSKLMSLYLAIAMENEEIIKILVEKGSNTNSSINSSKTTLLLAAHRMNEITMKRLQIKELHNSK